MLAGCPTVSLEGRHEAGGEADETLKRTFHHRLIAAVAALAVIALIGATFALAGSNGAGPGAYALVDPNGGSPRLIAAHTSGFTAVSNGAAGQGDYCLTPAPGVNVATPAAVADEEAFYSNQAGFVLVRYDPTHPNCSANQLEVKTFNSDVTALTNGIAFTVNVP